MQMRFFTIPVHSGEEAAAELNRFLAAHRVTAVDRSFVQDGANSAWAMCVSYEAADSRATPSKRPKIDYREVLNEQDFAVFAKLRALRKELAEREGVPVYAVLTNEQLAEIVQRRVQSRAALLEINGVGQARVDKYGEPLLALLRESLSGASEPNPDHAPQ